MRRYGRGYRGVRFEIKPKDLEMPLKKMQASLDLIAKAKILYAEASWSIARIQKSDPNNTEVSGALRLLEIGIKELNEAFNRCGTSQEKLVNVYKGRGY